MRLRFPNVSTTREIEQAHEVIITYFIQCKHINQIFNNNNKRGCTMYLRI